MTAPRHQYERREAARAAMIEVAIEELANGGYDGMTLAKVGTHAGYSRGLAPFHFGSKAGLMEAIIDRTDEVYREIRSAATEDCDTGLCEVHQTIEATFTFMEKYPAHARASLVILVECVVAVPEFQAKYAKFHERNVTSLKDAIKQGKRDGSIASEVDIDHCTTLITSARQGVRYEWLVNPALDMHERRASLHYLIDLLCPPAGADAAPARRKRTRARS